MKHLPLIAALFALSAAACGSAPPPPATQPVETTSAAMSREAFTPPGEFEMTIADKADAPEQKKVDAPPPLQGQADTTASKRQSGALLTLPSKAPAKTAK